MINVNYKVHDHCYEYNIELNMNDDCVGWIKWSGLPLPSPFHTHCVSLACVQVSTHVSFIVMLPTDRLYSRLSRNYVISQ